MKLFVIKSPYWYWSMRPQGSDATLLPKSKDPLDEHHTFFYYQFLKHRLVDEVVIYETARKELNAEHNIPEVISFPEGQMKIVYDPSFNEIRNTRNQIVYYRQVSGHIFPKHVNLIKQIVEGFPMSLYFKWLPFHVPFLCRAQTLKRKCNSLFLAEGFYNQRYVNKSIDSLVWPSLSAQHQYVTAKSKRYDWILVASLNPRKRVIEFCKELVKNDLTKLSGCVLLESGKSTHKYSSELLYLQEKIAPLLNIDIKFDLSCAEKMEMLCESRVFVCPSIEDSGPRAIIEAGQAGIPVVALKHHGSASYLIRPGINGEYSWRFSKLPDLLIKVIQNYDNYDCSINKSILDADTCFMPIADQVMKQLSLMSNKTTTSKIIE